MSADKLRERQRAAPLSESDQHGYRIARASHEAWEVYCDALEPGPFMDAVVQEATDIWRAAGISTDLGIAVKRALDCNTFIQMREDTEQRRIYVEVSDSVEGCYSGEFEHAPVGDDKDCAWGDQGLHGETCWAYTICRALLAMYCPVDDSGAVLWATD